MFLVRHTQRDTNINELKIKWTAISVEFLHLFKVEMTRGNCVWMTKM